MTLNKWLERNTASLKGKTVAITGSTGGIGSELCFYLARLEADLVLVDRNFTKSNALKEKIIKAFQIHRSPS